jgi:hypothetical protein
MTLLIITSIYFFLLFYRIDRLYFILIDSCGSEEIGQYHYYSIITLNLRQDKGSEPKTGSDPGPGRQGKTHHLIKGFLKQSLSGENQEKDLCYAVIIPRPGRSCPQGQGKHPTAGRCVKPREYTPRDTHRRRRRSWYRHPRR